MKSFTIIYLTDLTNNYNNYIICWALIDFQTSCAQGLNESRTYMRQNYQNIGNSAARLFNYALNMP